MREMQWKKFWVTAAVIGLIFTGLKLGNGLETERRRDYNTKYAYERIVDTMGSMYMDEQWKKHWLRELKKDVGNKTGLEAFRLAGKNVLINCVEKIYTFDEFIDYIERHSSNPFNSFVDNIWNYNTQSALSRAFSCEGDEKVMLYASTGGRFGEENKAVNYGAEEIPVYFSFKRPGGTTIFWKPGQGCYVDHENRVIDIDESLEQDNIVLRGSTTKSRERTAVKSGDDKIQVSKGKYWQSGKNYFTNERGENIGPANPDSPHDPRYNVEYEHPLK